mgnify:CR=1 FL=1
MKTGGREDWGVAEPDGVSAGRHLDAGWAGTNLGLRNGAGRLDDARAAYGILARRVPEPFGVRSLMLAALVGAPPPGP